MKKKIIDNIKTLFYALLIALFIRSLFFQPFYIPSSSMEPNLLVGDRLFVSKYSYGYSQHSFPFSPKIFSGRIFKKIPKRGDVVVFKTPNDNKTDYVKTLVGLPGDKIQIKDGILYINGNKIFREQVLKTPYKIHNQYLNEYDFAITRSGASAISELAFFNIPFIAIPFPFAKDDHQYFNAKYYETEDSCWLINQKEFNLDQVSDLLTQIFEDKNQYYKKKQNLKNLSNQNTWNNVNKKLLELLDEN